MYYCYFDTPIGELLLAGEADSLSMIGFPKGVMRRDPEADWIYNEAPFEDVRHQLREYFAGERKDFDLPLSLEGTEFQVAVLEALQQIPYGQTRSYGAVAKQIGRPKAVRAVGAAGHELYDRVCLQIENQSRGGIGIGEDDFPASREKPRVADRCGRVQERLGIATRGGHPIQAPSTGM